MSADLLLAYGTLMRGFPLHGLLRGRAHYVGDGRVSGQLLDLGAYPGAVPDTRRTLTGELYRVGDPALWSTLDSVEGPQYDRREVPVGIADGSQVTAFIYWYVGPRAPGVPVPGGDYRAYAAARSIHRLRGIQEVTDGA